MSRAAVSGPGLGSSSESVLPADSGARQPAKTVHPSAARRRAVASPGPRDAPVMSAGVTMTEVPSVVEVVALVEVVDEPGVRGLPVQ